MKNILICEDDDGIVEATKIILEDKGYKVFNSLSKYELMKNIKQLNPALLLMDLWMPNLNGEEVAKELKKDPKTKDIPIIIISASRDTERIAKESGVDDFICKPFDIDYFEEMVDKYAR